MGHQVSLVGDLINFRGLVYAPLNENGVVFLFGKVAEDLNMYVEEIKPGFPDCIARRFTGKGWERVRVEFEFKSSAFQVHGHNASECDMIICWEDDWPDCKCKRMLEVVELRERIKEFENIPVRKPSSGKIPPEKRVIEYWFRKYRMKPKVADLFERLWNGIKSQNERAFYKVGERLVSFYSPERVFLYLSPLKSMLSLWIYTAGRPLAGVKQFKHQKGAEKWGGLSVGSQEDLKKMLPAISESMKRIGESIRRNEPTGWYAKVEHVEGEEAE